MCSAACSGCSTSHTIVQLFGCQQPNSIAGALCPFRGSRRALGCKEPFLPYCQGALLWPETRPAEQTRRSNPAAPTRCYPHQCLRSTSASCALCPLSPTLAFSPEDPAVCHKSWKGSVLLHKKKTICGQKPKGSGSHLVMCYLGGRKRKEEKTRTANGCPPQPSSPTSICGFSQLLTHVSML